MSDMFSSARSYDRFMGRFSIPLARRFTDLLAPTPGQAMLDVGCGPGALTHEFIDAVGARLVSAVDPSPEFVAAARDRFPAANIGVASAESLPFPSDTFDLCAAQLVVHFMPDPVAGIREMSRVTKVGGVTAANVWDFGGGRGPLGIFEQAARDLDPNAPSDGTLPGASAGDMERIFTAAGLVDIRTAELTVSVDFATFDDWWDPFTLGVGPAGAYVVSLGASERGRLRDHARDILGERPFTIEATAFVATGVPVSKSVED